MTDKALELLNRLKLQRYDLTELEYSNNPDPFYKFANFLLLKGYKWAARRDSISDTQFVFIHEDGGAFKFTIDHYASMYSYLKRSGSHEEMYKMLKDRPFELGE